MSKENYWKRKNFRKKSKKSSSLKEKLFLRLQIIPMYYRKRIEFSSKDYQQQKKNYVSQKQSRRISNKNSENSKKEKVESFHRSKIILKLSRKRRERFKRD